MPSPASRCGRRGVRMVGPEVEGRPGRHPRRGRWFGELTARHELAIVTKFRDPLDYAMGTRPIFAQDLYDYANRLSARSAAATAWRRTATA